MQAKFSLAAQKMLRYVCCMENLKAYLKAHKATYLAQEAGITNSYLSDLKHGRRSPSLEVAFAIERATGGEVPVASWARDTAGNQAAAAE